MSDSDNEIVAWLKGFSQAVRDRNFADAEALFDPGVISFGTVGHLLLGRKKLKDEQWKVVWPKTTGFDFDYNTLVVKSGAALAVVMAEWASIGYDCERKPFPRRGRATLILEKQNSVWKAVHTHFSFTPSTVHDPLFHHASSSVHG